MSDEFVNVGTKGHIDWGDGFICDCEIKFSIEPHGEAYALYLGRCNHKHGYNLAKISDIAHNCDLKEIERLLNARANDKE